MGERLAYIRHSPQRVLDAGCGTGRDFALLRARYAKAALIGCDFSIRTLARARAPRSLATRVRALWDGTTSAALVAADLTRLPLASACIGLIWSNLALPWSVDPAATFAEWHRVLEIGGLVMFTTYGPDTLKELRAGFARPAHVHGFIDMHDLGDQLIQAGFAEPVMDMEVLTLEYTELDGLMRDLRASGQSNVLAERKRGLLGRGEWRAMRQRYESMRAANGKLPATIEIVYGHAWKPAPRRRADGRDIVEFDLNRGRRGGSK